MNQLEDFAKIKTFIFDVDGVMTNSRIIILENGKLIREMNMKDGLALKMAAQQGYQIAVISGGKSEGVRERLKNLGISDLYFGVEDKLAAFETFLETYKLDTTNILYMGDDLPDFQVMRRVGLPTCPSDAVQEVKTIAQYISPFAGGDGCVRDVIEKVMRLQGKWDNA